MAPKTPEEKNAAATIFSTLQQVALKEEEDQRKKSFFVLFLSFIPVKKRKLKNVDSDKSKVYISLYLFIKIYRAMLKKPRQKQMLV